MEYIQIKNSGLIEAKALTLVGASTKSGDSSKIGQFGSGNKYAMAYLLRNKIDMKIYSGLEEIEISTVDETFRDQVFGIIHVNNLSTSITTEMGKDWELWQAVREIYCNAIDEGSSEFNIVNKVEPSEDETHFYIERTPAINMFLEDFDNYFSVNKEVLFECPVGQILKKSGTNVNIYRKGIKCNSHENTISIFDYNLNNVDIDENRLIKYSWQPEEKIWDMIFQCTNKDVLTQVFHLVKNSCYESRFSAVSEISAKNMSDECKEVLQSLKLVAKEYQGLLKPDEREKHLVIPGEIFNKVRHQLKNENVGSNFKVYREGAYREVEPDEIQSSVIENALSFLKDAGFHVPYLVKTALFADKDVLGCADNDIIVLSEVVLERGVTDVINTIIEEFIHIKYGAEDETREFQTAIITEFITYIKKAGRL